MLLLKFFEKSLKTYFRYLFRYPESKFSGAVGSPQVHSIAQKSHKMLLRTPKNPKLQAMWFGQKVQAMPRKVRQNKGKINIRKMTDLLFVNK